MAEPNVPEDKPDDISEYLPLVRNMAHGMKARLGKFVEVEELIGDGSLGLVRAERYWRGDVPFRAFAICCIRQAMFDGYLASRFVRRCGLMRSIHKERYRAITMCSLDEPMGERSSGTRGDNLPDPRGFDPDRSILYQELLAVIEQLSPARKAHIGEMLADHSPQEIRELGPKYQAKVRAKRYTTIKLLRTMVGEKDPETLAQRAERERSARKHKTKYRLKQKAA